MKKIQILSILVFLTSCSGLKYLEAYNGFKGKPKEVESITYRVKYKDSLANEEIAYKSKYYFDSKGRTIKNLDYKDDGTLSSAGWNYKYDKLGNVIQITLYNLDSTINVQINKAYNKYGQSIAESSKSVNKKISYDRKKRTSTLISKKANGAFQENATVKYNKNWQEIELISYDSIGNLRSRIEFSYNKKGNQIESKWYNSKNIATNIYKSTYNSNNDRIRIDKYRVINGEPKLTNVTKTDYEYDELGNCIEERLISNGKVSWITRNKIKYMW